MSAGRRSGMVVATVLVLGALAGCGTSTSQKVQAKVQQFAHAVATRDTKTLCTQVFAPALLEHFAAAGLPCERAMPIYLRTVHDPTLAVGRVVINGDKAEAITLSGAKHQIGALDAIELVDTPSGWRVTGLGSPLLPGAAKKKKKK